jgi:hypothetical protein
MPAEVIERVHQLANQGNAPGRLSFADRTGLDPHAGDDEDDDDWDPDIEGDDNDAPLIADNIARVIDPDENDSGDENENDETESEDENEHENENLQNENENENLQNGNENENIATENDENENRQHRQNENENENLQNENESEDEENCTANDEVDDEITLDESVAEDHADDTEATMNQKIWVQKYQPWSSPQKTA